MPTYDDVRQPRDPVLDAIEVFKEHPKHANIYGRVIDGIDAINDGLDIATVPLNSPERLDWILRVLDAQIEPALEYIADRHYHDAFEMLIWGLARRAWQDFAYYEGIEPTSDNQYMYRINMRVRYWQRQGLRRLEELQAQVPSTVSLENRAERPSESPKEIEAVIERRKAMLSEYKAATGHPSSRRIYTAKNSGIHKPEFYDWVKGILPDDSSTCENFERFLKERKPPISRPKT